MFPFGPMNTALQNDTDCEVEELLDVVDAALAPLARRLPANVSREDLASAGRVALVETLNSFVGPLDEARAYCFTRVRGAMLDELRRLDPLSRRTRARVTVVRRAASEVAQDQGRDATAIEIAEVTGFSVAAVCRIEQLALAAEVYSNDVAADDVFHRFPDEDAASPSESAETNELASLMRDALERLPPRQSIVLRRYFFEEATLETIAGELSLSKERVRQIREAAVKRLRADYTVLALWQAFIARDR